MATNVGLPEGFVLDQKPQGGLPEGFVLDTQQQPSQQTSTPTLGGKLSNELSGVKKEFTTTQPGQWLPSPNPIHLGGHLARMGWDVASSAVSGLYHGLVPEDVQRGISEATTIGEPYRTKLVEPIKKEIGLLQQKYPETAQYASDIMAMSAIKPTITTGLGLLSEAKGAVKGGISAVNQWTEKATTEKIASLPLKDKQALINTADQGLNKVVNEGLAGTIGKKAKSTPQNIAENVNKTKAVEGIIQDPDITFTTKRGEISKIAQNTEDFAMGLYQRKFSIWNKKWAPAIQSTGADVAGYRVPLTNSINNLQQILDDRTILDNSFKSFVTGLRDQLTEIQKTGGYTIPEAQKFVITANSKLKTYFSKVSPETDTKLAVDANVAKDITKYMDDTVMNSTGTNLKAVRSEYGAILSMEQDVNKLRNKAAKQVATQGIPTYMDMATDWGILHGTVSVVLGASPLTVLPAATIKGLNMYRKYLQSYDATISKMFTEAEKYVNTKNKILGTISKEVIPPERQIGYTRQMPMADVSGVPKITDYTPKEWSVVKEGMKATYNNPEFWKQNKDITGLRLKIAAGRPLIAEEWNTLLQRVMMNKMGSNINSNIPLK